MRLIKPAILVLALTVLVTSIGNLFLGWQFSSLNTSLCMLLLGLVLLQAQTSDPGERNLSPSGIRLLGIAGLVLSGLVLARGLYRSDVVALLILPALVLLGYVLVRSLRDRRPREVAQASPRLDKPHHPPAPATRFLDGVDRERTSAARTASSRR